MWRMFLAGALVCVSTGAFSADPKKYPRCDLVESNFNLAKGLGQSSFDTTRRVEPAAAGLTSAPDAIRYEAADPIAVDVYRLADEGRSSIEIAKELDEHTGKIELILALRD